MSYSISEINLICFFDVNWVGGSTWWRWWSYIYCWWFNDIFILMVWQHTFIRYGEDSTNVVICDIIHLSEGLEFCCYDLVVWSWSIFNIRLIPLMVAIWWYELLVCMVISFVEDWEHIVELSSFLSNMGWNNISGWRCCIGDRRE